MTGPHPNIYQDFEPDLSKPDLLEPESFDSDDLEPEAFENGPFTDDTLERFEERGHKLARKPPRRRSLKHFAEV